MTEREEVPAAKRWHPSTRDNSMYKWQADPFVVGALEVHSEPGLDAHREMKPLSVSEARDEAFAEARQAWKDEQLRKSFIDCCEQVPVETCCCGLITDDDRTIKNLVPYLNNVWVPEANTKLEKHGFHVSVFLWHWSNIEGKSETTIILIRFHEIG